MTRNLPVLLLLAFVASFASAQIPDSGRELYEIGCAKCHGSDGRGVDPSMVGFSTPLPDFTDCRFTSREASADWIAVTHEGGKARGFASTMPAFGEAFDVEHIEKILDFLRGFCTNDAWPRGELNLPLAYATEKAFPEDEVYWKAGVDVEGDAKGFANEIVYEKRVGARHQWEVGVPFGGARVDAGLSWNGGIGDVSLGWKSALFHSHRSILSVGGEVVFPTGDENRGLGNGTFIYEPWVAYGRLVSNRWFLQAQGGFEFPADRSKAENEAFWRAVWGGSFAANNGFGRTWSPMVELLGTADLDFEETSWTVIPQMQVTLSARQHVRVNGGLSIPLTQRDERAVALVFYFLWDWFDGGLTAGW